MKIDEEEISNRIINLFKHIDNTVPDLIFNEVFENELNTSRDQVLLIFEKLMRFRRINGTYHWYLNDIGRRLYKLKTITE